MSDCIINDEGRIGSLGYCKAFAFEQITVGSTVTKLTSGIYGNEKFALITCEGSQIRYRVDGGIPTATVGHILGVNDTLDLNLHSEAVNFQAIAINGTATLSITYYV